MKIKRFVSALLCAVMLLLSLSACSDSAGVGDYDWEPEVIVQLEYDLYIVTESSNDAEALNAMKTVNSKINQYIDAKYNTILNIRYLSADEYESKIDELVTNASVSTAASTVISSAGRQKAGSIVLVIGEQMHDSLVEKNMLVDLKPFLDTKAFGSLNIQLTSSILEAASVSDDEGTHLYCIPNDHVLGEYDYTIIKRDLAEGILNFSAQTELLEMHILDGEANDEALELIAAINENLELLGVSDASEIISSVKGSYEDKAYYESLGYVCNVTNYPVVTKADALTAGFGILPCKDIYYNDKLVISASDCEKRAMEIIYAINADSTVRNLLQYGVEHTHYVFGEENYIIPTETNAYKMNLLYTGDIFNAYYSDSWTPEMAANGECQNDASFAE